MNQEKPLYTLAEPTITGENEMEIAARIDSSHPIFQGHFPGQPILPGVCMIDMLSDSLSAVVGQSVQLKSASQIKYLNVVDPLKNDALKLKISWKDVEGDFQVNCTSFLDETTANFKMKGKFSKSA